ncbi:MAG TPA: formyltransferase family protein [Victivallales bacterium]|nr:formyltransferase family protein [Victivallales bacterium]HPO90913.1 formyltransferase family protein [Victivallales bacterium]HRR28028.1 formyltransferase family protein [Victivallales bacterium]HRU01819.1 formyltransferase family protein [Victivallales bacterium]
MKEFLKKRTNQRPRAVIFMSGSGTNAEKLLESLKNSPTWEAALILTDNPQSRAFEIGQRFKIPAILHDIRRFYADKGEKSIALINEKRRTIREEWTEEMRKILKPFRVDFGILAGFVPLTNICADFPCLNVHPGDLTIEENGHRLLVGLHTIPIETAILAGHKQLRSSVIVAQPYTGRGGEMDSGPILGISEPVPINLNIDIERLCEIRKKRPLQKPAGGYKDALEEIAKEHQEKLKIFGDWTVFPPVVADFAKGLFSYDEDNNLYYGANSQLKKIKTVIYHANGEREPLYKNKEEEK